MVPASSRSETFGCIDLETSPSVGELSSASIGETVFRYRSYTISPEVVVASTPAGLRELPKEGWKKTYEYPGRDVYTHPDWYRGQIGAALDRNGVLIQYVQINGAQRGRRWKIGDEKFFGRERLIEQQWILRYGGRERTDYIFEIVDRSDDEARNNTQSFIVSEGEFPDEFVVRGVGIQGLAGSDHGSISYTISRIPSHAIGCPPELRNAT